METVLDNVNAIPGVVGSLICDAQGQVLAQAFPAAFDGEVLREAAAALADGSLGLETATGPMALIDLRYANARVLAKRVGGALLLLLCARSVNFHVTTMSLSVAARRLEQVITVGARARTQAPAPRPRAEVAAEARSVEKPAAGRADRPQEKKRTSWWPSV